MDAALPQNGRDDGDGVADEAFHNPMFKDAALCTVGAPSPPRDAGGGQVVAGGGGGDADKPSRDRTFRARVALGVGLALEVAATVWAFWQAVSAGALDGEVDCSDDGPLSKLYVSYLVTEQCDERIDADGLPRFTDGFNETSSPTDDFSISGSFTDDLYEPSSGSTSLEEHVECDSLTDTVDGVKKFQKLCSCYGDRLEVTSCAWIALSSPWDDICYAQGVYTNPSENGTVVGLMHPYDFIDGCWASNPVGAMKLTIMALAIALSSQALEAVVGFKYWKDIGKRTAALTLALSVFETLGVVAVASVLLTLPGFSRGSGFFLLAWTIVPIPVVGALVEITAEYSDYATSRVPYLGAVGNGLIWFGAALLEVTVTWYVLWTGAKITDIGALALEAAGLFILELLGLVSMWAARCLWTRAKLMSAQSVKRLERSLSRRASSTRSKSEKPLSKRVFFTYSK